MKETTIVIGSQYGRSFAAFAAAALALTLTACGSSAPQSAATGSAGPVGGSSPTAASDSATGSSAVQPLGKDEQAAALVPSDIRSKGSIVVATDVSYPPFEFFDTDNKTIIGADADLITDVGQVLGLKIDLKNTPFDGIVPGLAAEKFDAAISGMADVATRRDAATFVDYATNGAGFLLDKADAAKYPSYASLCGHTAAVQSGTTMADDTHAAADNCSKDGKPAATVSEYKTQDEVVLALRSHRADVAVLTGGSAAYIVTQSKGALVLVTPNDITRPRSALGIAVPKKDSQLAEALQAAVKVLIADGRYQSIMTKWGLSDCCSDTKATINDDAGA